MQLPILIEPVDSGGFRAHAGSPFVMSADGVTETEAAQRLSVLIKERLEGGARLAKISVPNGASTAPQALLQLEALPEDDWFFRTLGEAIAENRQREDKAGQ